MNAPLTKTDLANAAKAIYELKVNRDRIEKLAAAGGDVADARERNEFSIRRLEAILEAYGSQKG